MVVRWLVWLFVAGRWLSVRLCMCLYLLFVGCYVLAVDYFVLVAAWLFADVGTLRLFVCCYYCLYCLLCCLPVVGGVLLVSCFLVFVVW